MTWSLQFLAIFFPLGILATDCPPATAPIGVPSHLCANYISTISNTFDYAQQMCRNHDSSLMLPLTIHQSQSLANNSNQQPIMNADIWVNLRAKYSPGDFLMENGQRFALEYFNNWMEGQPATGDCVALNKDSMQFYTAPCTELKKFYCEQKKVTCSYPFIAQDDLCLTTRQSATGDNSVDSGKAACECIGGFLPYPTDMEENKLLQSYWVSRFPVGGTFGPLLGLRRLDRYSGATGITGAYQSETVLDVNWNPNGDTGAMCHVASKMDPNADLFAVKATLCDYLMPDWATFFCQMEAVCIPPLVPNGVARLDFSEKTINVTCDPNFSVSGDTGIKCTKKGLNPQYDPSCQ